MVAEFANPFRPGAGHMPPYLAGRETEKAEFSKFLSQDPVLQNLILTGLRGVGKTVLLETLKPLAIEMGWLWVGTDLSETASLTEENLAVRMITDLSVITSGIVIGSDTRRSVGLTGRTESAPVTLDYYQLLHVWNITPGLASDKLKAVLEMAWSYIAPLARRGVVFAYDEAQNLADHAAREQYPLSLLLDVFQSLQRRGIPFLLVLTGLPTLFPKLVESRTFSERMFHLIFLDRLTPEDSAEAMTKPIDDARCPVRFSAASVQSIYEITRGYPYFIQFVCREVFDVWSQQSRIGEKPRDIPRDEITRKLDTDFFAGRWSRATDRQRDLLGVIAQLDTSSAEFTVQEVVTLSKELSDRPFSPSHVSQMLVALGEAGLVYKNRWGKYSLAVPLLDQFIRRQLGVTD